MIRKTQIANRKNYGSWRALSKIKYLVIHYTANDGDSDESNAKYFANRIVEASAHYFVDSDSITQSVPDDYVAWSVGGAKRGNGGGRLYGIATNNNTLNIELCDEVKNGVIYPTEATIQNALVLVRELMAKYNIPQSNVIRHYDVNGKACPAYWTNDARWKAEFWNKIGQSAPQPVVNDSVDVFYRVYAGKWYGEIKNDSDYAGVENKEISAVMAKTTKGKLSVRVSPLNKGYYGWASGYNTADSNNGYAGALGKAIDRIQFKLEGLSGYEVEYRVSLIGSTGYLPWVKGTSDYAGVRGKVIDKIQVRIVRK